MHRDLTYVAMTRYRDGVELYAAQEDFADRRAGSWWSMAPRLTSTIRKPRELFRDAREPSWREAHDFGCDLGRAMGEASSQIGDRIGLEHKGSETVRLPDGTSAERNAWAVHEGGEFAYGQMEERPSRTGLLTRLRIPERLWSLAPATFSGGEQQRINIARGFVVDYPILLLDEPTASLDAANRVTVVDLINEAKSRGAAIVGIFHDAEVREGVADRLFEITQRAVELAS